MANYKSISEELKNQIREDRLTHKINPYAFKNEDAIRRFPGNNANDDIFRPVFVRDIAKIMNVPFYNRYGDKTQVLSFYANDDITRRSTHVQLVSRIARDIGAALNLNLDLIEAISLGHDIGHTPFGHAGERALSKLYFDSCQKYFNHNINSARVLDTVFPLNLTLQTLDGIICHNGEMVQKEYRPVSYSDFATFDKKISDCTIYEPSDKEHGIKGLIPATLEGCVMRIADIIAYLGKDRQDAIRLGIIDDENGLFNDYGMGTQNAEIINNISVDIIEHSYGKPYLSMSEDCYKALKMGKDDNYKEIYRIPVVDGIYNDMAALFEALYHKIKSDYEKGDESSPVFTHHLNYIRDYTRYLSGTHYTDRADLTSDDIAVDFIASMTDDYFIDICKHFGFTIGDTLNYRGYFE